MMRVLSPIPMLYGGFPLHPDDDNDPYIFRVDLARLGMEMGRVIFSREPGRGTTAVHFEFGPLSFQKQPASKNPRLWATGALSVLVVATTAKIMWRQSGRRR